ncbi:MULTISPECIES: hypothetical protein [unclassified Limnothrix]|nr:MULTISPECIES: hypothetical protein [unclassified Limnothrix]
MLLHRCGWQPPGSQCLVWSAGQQSNGPKQRSGICADGATSGGH